jgi:subtilisin family serine protease
MRRLARRAALAPSVEVLEDRSLLSTSDLGMWPLRLPDASSGVLVRFASNASSATIEHDLTPLSAWIVDTYASGTSWVALGEGVSRDGALRMLNADPGVIYAEADAPIHVSFIPNDPLFPQLWGLSSPNGVSIDAPAAWDVTPGLPNTVVAVVDSGIDLGNPDLAGQLWTNPGFGPADLGYWGDVHGWNFLGNNANISDQDGHGTHISGIIAAAGNNAYGVVGVAPGVKLMVLKFIGADGNGSTDEAVRAIIFAVQHGAKVINASWGGSQYSQSLHDAISYANDHGVVFVTAAGNESANNDVTPSYPALDRLPNQISVAAVDQSGNLASFSNYGPKTVDLAAPGVNILSTIPGGFASYSGTSMSTPYVTGVVALVASIHPTWSASQLVHQVLATVKPLPSLQGITVSGGMVDAARAVGAVGQVVSESSNQVATDDVVEARVLGSDEFWNLHGGNNVGFVQGLYEVLLAREPDAGGIALWVGKLQQSESRASVALEIESTLEAKQTKIAEWFIAELGRPAPLLWALKQDAEIISEAAQLTSGSQSNNARNSMILGSDEYFRLHGGTFQGFVQGLYEDLTGRAPDAGGSLHWLGLLQGGESRSQVAFQFITTQEARVTEVARWFINNLGRTDTLEELKADAGVIQLGDSIAG